MSERGPTVLVGMMGAGKTTVGRALAARLGVEFVDTDDLVAAAAGCSIRDLFDRHGEEHFRKVEAAALEDALREHRTGVIGCGGGVVIAGHNRRLLQHAPATVVWLRATPAALADRLNGDTGRPLLDGDALGKLHDLMTERSAWYAEVADAVIDVDGRTVDEIVEEIVEAGA